MPKTAPSPARKIAKPPTSVGEAVTGPVAGIPCLMISVIGDHGMSQYKTDHAPSMARQTRTEPASKTNESNKLKES